MTQFITSAAVLAALLLCVPIQAQTPQINAWRTYAARGNAEAQFLLGIAYVNGEGVPQDDARAVRWYRLGAEQGHALAQFYLGLAYAEGQGAPEDDIQAHMWYTLAAAGAPDNERRVQMAAERDDVAQRMRPAQIAEAQRLAREWDAAHPREP